MLGGSHSYGLNTPASDTDYRGVFIHTEVSKIVGLDRYEHQDIKAGGADEFYSELRHFLNSCRKCNTQALELLYNDNWLEVTDDWKLIQEFRSSLLDTEGMYKCLKGYIFGERRLFNGERVGEAGGKRREAIEKYGFSPKNWVQLIRLSWAGIEFFKTGIFPVNVKEHNPELAEVLLEVKTNPENYSKDYLLRFVDQWETLLNFAFDNRDKSKDFKFDSKVANNICLMLYKKPLENEWDKFIKNSWENH
jgi:hypothetical protein